MNYVNHKGTFFLGTKGDIYLESSHFYRNHFYVEEELALFITEMIEKVIDYVKDIFPSFEDLKNLLPRILELFQKVTFSLTFHYELL